MDEWNWDEPKWEPVPETAETPSEPKRRKTIWDLLIDQCLFFLILMIAFFGVKFLAKDHYDGLRVMLQERLSETTSLETVLGTQEKKTPETAVPKTEKKAAPVATSNVTVGDTVQEYDEDSAEDCVFDLDEIRLLSGNRQAVNGMCMPIQSTNVTSQFGYRVNPVTGAYAMHSGLDLGADYGEPIYAALDGTVVKAKSSSDYGNFIALDHGDGLVTLYAHCSQLLVDVDEHVSKGQIIARAGSTGRSTGPHLHFEVRVQGVRIDPSYYLPKLYSV